MNIVTPEMEKAAADQSVEILAGKTCSALIT